MHYAEDNAIFADNKELQLLGPDGDKLSEIPHTLGTPALCLYL